MNNKLILSALLNTTGNFPVSYTAVLPNGEKKLRYIDGQLRVHEVEQSKKIVDMLDVPLNSKNGFQYFIDLDTPGIDEKKIKLFFEEHPLTQDMSGSSQFPKQGEMLYGYLVGKDKVNQDIKQQDEIINIVNVYKNLTDDQVEKIAVYHNLKPWDYTKEDLRIRLVGLNEGVITNDKYKREQFINNLESYFDVKMLNVRSAILNGVIDQRERVFYFRERILGTTQDEVLQNVYSDEGLYVSIISELKAQGRAIESKTELEKTVNDKKAQAEKQAKDKAKKEISMAGVEGME
jgi:hypothetical protein